MVLGYAYPAFECFKTVERNKVEIHELRFWCQYWIIVAILTVIERFGDVFVAWLPMYNEMKLALFLYLWYPQAKGTRYVYHTFLRPLVVRHEPDIDRNFQELRARAWDLAIYYWNNWTDLGQTAIFQILDYLTGQRGKINDNKEKNQLSRDTSLRPFLQMENDKKETPHHKRRSFFSISKRSVTQPTKPSVVQIHLQGQTANQFMHAYEELEQEYSTDKYGKYKSRSK